MRRNSDKSGSVGEGYKCMYIQPYVSLFIAGRFGFKMDPSFVQLSLYRSVNMSVSSRPNLAGYEVVDEEEM